MHRLQLRAQHDHKPDCPCQCTSRAQQHCTGCKPDFPCQRRYGPKISDNGGTRTDYFTKNKSVAQQKGGALMTKLLRTMCGADLDTEEPEDYAELQRLLSQHKVRGMIHLTAHSMFLSRSSALCRLSQDASKKWPGCEESTPTLALATCSVKDAHSCALHNSLWLSAAMSCLTVNCISCCVDVSYCHQACLILMSGSLLWALSPLSYFSSLSQV